MVSSESIGSIASVAANAQVFNGAGTELISTGNVANSDEALIITNLSDPTRIHRGGVYQVRTPSMPRLDYLCDRLEGTTATFVR